MTITNYRRTQKKIKKSFIITLIIFTTLFSGIIPLIDLPSGTNDEPKVWYNPQLSDFLYQDSVFTNNSFNAYNESYILCKIQNTDYTVFWFNGTQYDVSYGINIFPVDFGNVNQSYSIDISQADVNNDIFDWISVQPLYIESDIINVNLTSTTDISFYAGGEISILMQPNFSYNWLYLELDDVIINNICNTSTYPEFEPVYAISFISEGIYIQFDLDIIPEEHTLKIKGNGSVDYKIITNYDWDQDSVSDAGEIQKMRSDSRFDPIKPFVFGYFEKGANFLFIDSSEYISGLFTFYIPETYKGLGFTYMTIYSGEVKNVIIDDNDLLYEGQTFETDIINTRINKYLGDLSSGFHTISYDFAGDKLILISFSIDGQYIKVLDGDGDSDGDGAKNLNEIDIGSDTLNPDSDYDGLYDGYDSSPLTSMELDSESIMQIVFPHDSSKNTIIEISVERPENDYSTNETMIWKEEENGGLEVSIVPMLRLFGNSTINLEELSDTWDKEIISYFISDTSSSYGDGVPDSINENAEVCFIMPSVSNRSFQYTFNYEIGHSAKSDNKIDMRFDIVWTVFSINQNSSEIIHYYNFDENIILQSINKKEIANISYILASPDSMIENEILWNLVQNSELGSASEFEVSDDIVGSGSVDYFSLEEQIIEDRDSNPISTNIDGEINETEVLYASLNFNSSDLLYDIDVLDEWIDIPDNIKYHGDYEAYISFYSKSDVIEEQIGILQPEENMGNYRICYTKAWDNYSTGELGGFEQRYTINQYPIYMKRNTTFQNAEVLEVSSVFGKQIPLNKLPDTRNEVSYDKLSLVNTTIIEKNDDSSELAKTGFDYDKDEIKSCVDARRWEVPLSNLIFHRYSWSFVERILTFLVNLFLPEAREGLFNPNSITYIDQAQEFQLCRQSEMSSNIVYRISYIGYDYTDVTSFFTGLNTGVMETDGGWSNAFNIAWSDSPDISLSKKIESLDIVIDYLESEASTTTLESQRIIGITDIVLENDDVPTRQKLIDDLDDVLTFQRNHINGLRDDLLETAKTKKEYLKNQLLIEKRAFYRQGFVSLFQGVVCLLFSVITLIQGLVELNNLNLTENPLTLNLRIASAVSKVVMAGCLAIMSYKLLSQAYWSFKLVEKSVEKSVKFLGKIATSIGFMIICLDYFLTLDGLGIFEGEKFGVEAIWSTIFLFINIGAMIVGYFNPPLGFFIGIISWIIQSIVFWEAPKFYSPNLDIIEEGTSLSLSVANFKRHGSLEVGDEVNLTLRVHNNGNTMSYFRANFSTGGDYSDYEGKWVDDEGYTVDEEQDLNLTRTFSETSVCSDLFLGIDIDAEIESTRTPIHEDTQKLITNFLVLDSSISDFYDDLSEWDKPSDYDYLIQKLESLKDSYKHNETSEALNQLKQRIDYDFLDDDVGSMPSGWTATESDDGVFSTILRPNRDDLDAHKWSWSTGTDYYTEIDEDIVDPSLDVDYPSTIIQWSSSDYYFDGQWRGNYVKFNFTDFDSFSSCLGVKLHIAGEGNNDPEDETKFDISFDDGSSWESEKSVRIDGDYTWYTLSWSGLDESDLDDFKVRIECPDLPSTGSYSDIDVLYAEIFYKVSSIANTSLVSDYLNHNNIVNISLNGENASRSLIRDFGSSKTSGTIEFWMCKDNYARIDVDSFFRINKLGDLVKYGTDTSIRARQIELNVWNNFKIIYTSSLFDLYLNGIKIGDYISYSDSDDTEFNLTISHDFDWDDVSKFNVSSTYIDAIDFSWSSGYYDGRSFYWDYSLENITKYENLYDDLIINTSISTDLSENIVELSTTTNIAEFVFDLDLVGTEYPNINITLFNIPTGFTANTTEIFQSLQDTINFKITDTGTLDYSGVYYLEMNITLSENDTIIYYEKIPFRIPLVEDLDFDYTNVIYEDDTINSENYTATYDFLDDTVGQNPSNWAITGEPTQGTIDIISNLDGHNNVLELHDTSDTGRPRAFQFFSGGFGFPTYGTLDFWMRTDDATDSSQVILGDGGTLSAIYLVIESDKFQYYDGTWKDIGISATDDVWYHVSIDFELTDGGYMYLAQNKWQVRINGELYGSFDDALTPIEMDRLEVSTVPDDTGYYAYFDAIGYSWDDNYIIGENRFETDTIITGITESQVTKGDVVNVEFITNTYAEVQMKFVNNDIVQETYTILPRGNDYRSIQSRSFIVDTSITFDEIQFTKFKYNYFDVLQISIIDSLSSVGTSINPVNITNDGNAPEYVQFDISGVDVEDLYATSSPGTVANIDRDGNEEWTNVNNVKTQSDSYASVSLSGGMIDYLITPSAYDDINNKWSSESNAYDWDNGTSSTEGQSRIINDIYWQSWNTPGSEPISSVDVRVYLDLVGLSNDFLDIDIYVGGSQSSTTYRINSANDGTDLYINLSDVNEPNDGSWSWTDVGNIEVRFDGTKAGGYDSVQDYEVFEVWGIVHSGDPGTTESDYLKCTDFNFADSIPKDTVITGVVVEIDEYASVATTIKDYELRLLKPNGEVSSDKKSSEYWDTTDDNFYEIYGSYDDTWNLDLSYDDVTNENFGIEVAVKTLGASSIAYIDHVRVKIYYSKSFVTEILPGETIEMNFTIEQPIESFNNLMYRGVTYQHLGSNNVYQYVDNFEIDGIYIASPLNTTYNLIGNNLSCNKNEFSLEIIPEVTLTTMEYSLDGDTPTSFSGNSANVTLPEEPGMHSIQVFGLVGETEYESEIRNFTIQYPIGIVSPNETENTIFHEFLEDYDSFNSNDVNTEPEDWTVVNSESEDTIYITGVDLEYGGGGSGVANAQIDDDNYFHLTAFEQGTDYNIYGYFTFNIEPADRDFLISYHMETTGLNPDIILKVNDITWKTGEILDSDNVLKSGINSVSLSAYDTSYFTIRIYFFEMIDISKEGTVEVIESMNGMNKPVQIINNNFNSEFSIERDFPDDYETGNVSFSILRELITDKNTVLITLTGTSGTMVYTLENNDLYYGSYSIKASLVENVLKQDIWQEFVIFFNVSEGCQLFVDGVNTTMPDEYMDFSTGTPIDINTFKIETLYHLGESYSFWFDNFLVNEIKGGLMLDVYNRFVFLDDLQYSFDEGVKKSFTNRELFSFPEDGQHNIIIYGTDIYGDEYYSEFKIFITEEIYNIVEYLHATPDQWDDFDYEYGSTGGIEGTGSTEYDDADNYAYMNAEISQGAGGGSVYSDPSNDAGNNGWIYTPLYECINDGRRYPTTTGFSDGYLTGNYADYFYVDMTNVVIPVNNFITAIKIYGYIYTSKEDYYEPLECSYRFEGYTGWSSQGTIGGTTSWAWYSRTFGVTFGLYGDDEADALQIRFDCEQWMSDSTVWYIEAAYAQISYAPMEYKHTSIINTTIPIENFDEIKIFYYDYATTTSVDCDLDIYNWNTLQWEELASNSGINYITGTKALTDAYLSDEYNVQIRFETATTLNDFDIRLDQIMVTYNTIVKKEL